MGCLRIELLSLKDTFVVMLAPSLAFVLVGAKCIDVSKLRAQAKSEQSNVLLLVR
jgi:hypothetical protein